LFASRIADLAGLQAEAAAGRGAGRKGQVLTDLAERKKVKIYLTRVGIFR